MTALPGYTKLFSDIVTSTIWQEPNDCRVLWITMIALKGRDHVCTATVPALAKMCNITVEECEKYLDKFQSPDKYSRSQEFEGRRIRVINGGFLILNGQKFTEKLSRIEETESVRERVRKHRKTKRCNSDVTVCNGSNGNVTECNGSNGSNAHTDTYTDLDQDTEVKNTHIHARDEHDITTPSKEQSKTTGIYSSAPTSLKVALREVWAEIAASDGPDVATRALEATARLFGGPGSTPARMRETYSAAHERGCLAKPADQWPDFRTVIARSKAGIQAPTASMNESQAEDHEALKRVMERNKKHVI